MNKIIKDKKIISQCGKQFDTNENNSENRFTVAKRKSTYIKKQEKIKCTACEQ